MKKIILIGRTGSGKTTLSQIITGEKAHYDKTQYIKQTDEYIDTPGEYSETKLFGGALAVYSYDSDVVGLVQSACEQYTMYPPCITPMANRPVIGIITKIDSKFARTDLAENWLRLAGCNNIFFVSSKTGEGIEDLIKYLKS